MSDRKDLAEGEHHASKSARSLRSIFQEAHEQIQERGAIPHDQFWQEVEQARRDKQPPLRGKRGK